MGGSDLASPGAPRVVAKPPMSRDAEAKNLRLYDRRTIERNIKKGLITRKDYDKFLKSLEDAKDKGVSGEVEVDDDIDDDTDDENAITAPGETNSH
jgi:hypothetical protein